MRIACGIDIIEIDRIKKSITNIGNRFIEEIYTKQEINYCESKNNGKFQHYAVRFAAKESIFKALNSFIEDKYSISWRNLEIINDNKGKPYVNFIDIEFPNIVSIDISLSHCKEYAVANTTIIYEEKKMKLFDSHAHYNDKKFETDNDEIITKIKKFGIEKFVVAGYNLESSKKAIEIANKYDNVYATVRNITK